jgi:hypothetical protein
VRGCIGTVKEGFVESTRFRGGGGFYGSQRYIPVYGDGVLKMCCFVVHFRLYADVTSKIRQIGNAVSLPERVQRRKSP